MEEKTLFDKGFTKDQIREIKEGEKAGLDVSLYAKKEFLAIQMMQIRLGMQEGLPAERYASEEYDWFQMEEIRKGLKANLKVDLYASPDVPYDKMRQIRKGLEKGIDLSKYLRLPAGMLRQLRKACLDKVNIVEYIKEGYDTEQIEEIRKALKKGINVKPYLQKELRGISIEEISKGLQIGIDVSAYATMDYCWQQMREIRLGLQERLDISTYKHPFFDWRQMREIRLGLEEGLDVAYYNSLMYTAREMQKRRRFLLSLEQKDTFQSPEKENFDHFRIIVDGDEMKAYIEVLGNVKSLARNEIMQALSQSGVTSGIEESAVRDLVNGNFYRKPVLIAKGMEPENGEDGYYEYFFKTNVERAPKVLPDGSVDYQNMQWFELVEQGQKIVRYHSAGIGRPGITVTGRILNPQKGKEKSMLTGTGFMVMPDHETYLATVSGKIDLVGDRLEISRVLVLDEMNLATGNMVDFDGSVYVKGNIGGGTVIKATEDVAVDGFVESAMIESGGNVVLHQGVNASGNGIIRAAKSVIGKFFEAVKVYAGEDIRANYALNSELYSEGRIVISGKSGTLAGGTVYAVRGVKAYNIGNRAGISTYIKIGMNETISKSLWGLEEKIKEIGNELGILGNAYMEMQRKYEPEVRNTMDVYLKIENAIFTKEKQMEAVVSERDSLREAVKELAGAKAEVEGWLFEGIVMEINGLRWVSREMQRVEIKKVASRIAVYAR